MVGIRFEYDVTIIGTHFLYDILKNVCVESYIWKLVDDDIYPIPMIDNSCVFNTEVINGQTFLSKISLVDYQVIFCTLQAYPLITSSEDINIPLSTYSDYVKSECCIVLVVIDNRFVDFLAKDEEIIKQVYNNALHNKFKKVQLLDTVDDDTLLSDIH